MMMNQNGKKQKHQKTLTKKYYQKKGNFPTIYMTQKQ